MTSAYYFCLVLATLTGWAYSTVYDYIVYTKTTDKYYAGTDAPVYIKFYGTHDQEVMGERPLIPESNDPFGRGDHDKAHLTLKKHLGRISSIAIKRGSTSWTIGDDWYLDKVVVEDPFNEFLYVFDCFCKLLKADEWKKMKGSLGCKKGYLLSNGKCNDVDECKQAGICKDKNVLCTNTKGSYHCRKCKDEYEYDGTKCQDIDECQRGTSNCQQKCENRIGGYVCDCYVGYKLKNQFQCRDVDECKKQPCDSRATCVNQPGTYTCYCPSGYDNKNNKCTNIDECKRFSTSCDWKTSVNCIDYDGGYRCVCKQGFYNAKDSLCKDINECQGQNTCDARSSVCENLNGNYRCNCLPGFIASTDLKSCIARTCSQLTIPNGAVVFPSRCTKPDSNSYNDVCTFSCTAGYKISNASHSKLTCGQHASWVGTIPTCTPASCISRPPPINGRTIPSLCSSGGTYKQTCSFLCDDGYVRAGPDKSICQANGIWSAKTPSCKKVINDAWIRCPPGISVVLKSGENTADISSLWKLPRTSTNVKYSSSSHNKNDRFPVGMTFVTWTVSSENRHKRNCSFAVTVYDKEKPVAVDCPRHPLAILTTKDKELVNLAKVQFTDNVAIKSVEYSFPNPVELKIGTHVVTVVGKDTSDNIGYCMYQVILRSKGCGEVDAPSDGDRKCSSVAGSTYCSVSCRDDKIIFNATGNWLARTWYCLGNNPAWLPTPKVPDCVDYIKYNGSSCPAGKVLVRTTLPKSAASVIRACGACPSGNYYENKQCKECPAGTYQDTTGNNGAHSCKKCGPNTSSRPGSTKKVDCKALCAPGFYSADGFHPCQLCKRGEYQPKFGSKSCDKCPQGRVCTRHVGAVSILSCGPCPSISRMVPSGNVQRLLGSTLQLACYTNVTGIAGENIKWHINLNATGAKVGGYVKKLYDSNHKQLGLQLKIRNLKVQHTGNYICSVENQFGEERKSILVTVVDDNGSGFGPVLNANV